MLFHLYYLDGFIVCVQSTDDWIASVKIMPLGFPDENCPLDPSEKTFRLPSTSR